MSFICRWSPSMSSEETHAAPQQRRGSSREPAASAGGRRSRVTAVNRKWARRFCCQQSSVDSVAERALLAVGDRPDARSVHAERDEVFLRGVGAPVAQREVVLGRPALVAMPLDQELDRPVLLEPVRVRGQRRARVVAQVGLVVVEERVLQVAASALISRDVGQGAPVSTEPGAVVVGGGTPRSSRLPAGRFGGAWPPGGLRRASSCMPSTRRSIPASRNARRINPVRFVIIAISLVG